MAHSQAGRRGVRRRGAGHNPLIGPLLLFGGVLLVAAAYVAYVLWPRWPEAPVARNAPSLPIVIAGVTFDIEPAAIRMAVQRRAGTQARVDLVYLWPSLKPPDPAAQPTAAAPPGKRLFVTIAADDGTLPLVARMQEIYPRYLAAQPAAGPAGLTLRGFRDDTPYRGEELAFETAAPTHFLARCTLRGVSDDGNCLLERRIGAAEITFRFPRDWLNDWQSVVGSIDRLLARLHPG
jgi:hypothetical protein